MQQETNLHGSLKPATWVGCEEKCVNPHPLLTRGGARCGTQVTMPYRPGVTSYPLKLHGSVSGLSGCPLLSLGPVPRYSPRVSQGRTLLPSVLLLSRVAFLIWVCQRIGWFLLRILGEGLSFSVLWGVQHRGSISHMVGDDDASQLCSFA